MIKNVKHAYFRFETEKYSYKINVKSLIKESQKSIKKGSFKK